LSGEVRGHIIIADMPQIRASRLDKSRKRQAGFLTGPLPYGTFKRKVVLWVVFPLVILLLAYVMVDSVVMPIMTRQGTEFPLPDFVGQRTVEARMSLEQLGLRHEIASQEYSPGKEQGVILSQFPIAGTKVKKDRAIKFVVSLGQKLVSIPQVAGLSVRQAMLDMETAGLGVGEIVWAFSDTLPEKVVVFSYPAAGSEIVLGSSVNLAVNRGRAADFTYVPTVVGLTLNEADTRLREKFLKRGVITYRIDERYLPETVLEQSEPGGAELDIGTEIDLVVSAME